MNAQQIAATMAQAVGDPGTGPVAEAIPTMAQAVADALTPKADDDAKPKAQPKA